MASSQYYVRNQEGAYFLTMTVMDWMDVFTRPSYRQIMVESLHYCQLNKGLRRTADAAVWLVSNVESRSPHRGGR